MNDAVDISNHDFTIDENGINFRHIWVAHLKKKKEYSFEKSKKVKHGPATVNVEQGKWRDIETAFMHVNATVKSFSDVKFDLLVYFLNLDKK